MMKFRLLFMTILTGCYTLQSHAEDTLRIDRKVWQSIRADKTFAGRVWENPALKYFIDQPSLSQLAIEGFVNKEKESVFLQQGDGENGFAVKADSYLKLGLQSKVWGTASYTHQKRTSVQWNESSDYEKIYPYVTADAQGGDLDSETYRFSGGYAHETGKYTWAATLAYKAIMEYRNVDPRPKNTVSDLLFTLGGSRSIAGNYRGAVSIHAGKYKQDNTLKFVSALGGVPVYHLTGLGMQYVRFAGSNTSVLYDGASFGGSLDLLPENNKGFAASVGYNRFGYDKQMGDLGDLTLCKLSEDELTGEVSYMNGQRGVKASMVHKKRTGTENIFGSPNGSIYPYLNSVDNYFNKQNEFKLTGIYGRTSSTLSWNLLPEMGFRTLDIEYLEPERHLRGKLLLAKLGWEGNKAFRHSSLSTMLGMGYQHSLDIKQQMDGQTEEDVMKVLTDNTYKRLSSNILSASAMIRWDLPVRSIKGGLFVQANGEYTNYQSFTTAWNANLTVGIVF